MSQGQKPNDSNRNQTAQTEKTTERSQSGNETSLNLKKAEEAIAKVKGKENV